jgi:uncharacterized lipoprotein YddW (UPF0748 family)
MWRHARRLLPVLLAAACAPAVPPAAPAPEPVPLPPRIVAVWPHSDYKPWQSDVHGRDPRAVVRELDWLREIGANTYFPLAFASGRVNWPSQRFPDTRVLFPETSPVDVAVGAADARGIATELYFIVGFVGFLEDPWAAPDLRANPQWDLVDLHGKGTLTGEAAGTRSRWGTFLWWDLGHPDVQARLLAILAEAVDRYPTAAGVHLDYIRSAHNGGCFSEACLGRFQRATGIRLPDHLTSIAERARHIQEHHGEAYVAWRAEEITGLVRRIRAELTRRRPGIRLTASVFSGADGAYRGVFQDWRGWAGEGLVDAVYPMFYGDAMARWSTGDYVRQTIAQIEERARAAGRTQRAAVVLGIQTAPYDPLPPAAAEQAIREAVAAGADGIALQMLPYWWQAQYREFRDCYLPASAEWPPLWDYDALLRALFRPAAVTP